MRRRTYEEIPQLPRSEGLRMLQERDGPTRSRALLALALHDEDWRWVQNLSLELINDADPAMRGTAVLALAHLARIHRKLDLDKVLPELNRLKHDAAISGRVEDALSDIESFLEVPPAG